MTAKSILEEWLSQTDQTNLKRRTLLRYKRSYERVY